MSLLSKCLIHLDMADNLITMGKQYGKDEIRLTLEEELIGLGYVAQDAMMASPGLTHCWPGS